MNIENKIIPVSNIDNKPNAQMLKVLKIPVKLLPISASSANSLRLEGIKTLRDILEHKRVTAIPCFGSQSIISILEFMKYFKFDLSNDALKHMFENLKISERLYLLED